MGQGATNKRKGCNAERKYAEFFRELGFPLCVTSRYGSKLHDDTGIDLINIPYNIQIKAGKQRGLNPSKLLREISERIKVAFAKKSKERKYPLILIHKKEVGKGNKRDDFDELVTMSLKDFQKLLKNKK